MDFLVMLHGKCRMCFNVIIIIIFYLNVVGEPVETGICVFHSKEHVASRYYPAFWNGFDPYWKTTVMFLTK